MSQIQLIRQHDSKMMFEAAYVKYYPNPTGPGMLPFCALFENYPAIETNIQICKRVGEDSLGNMNVCRLISQGQEVGYYIPISSARSEKEANTRVDANYRGLITLRMVTNKKR